MKIKSGTIKNGPGKNKSELSGERKFTVVLNINDYS